MTILNVLNQKFTVGVYIPHGTNRVKKEKRITNTNENVNAKVTILCCMYIRFIHRKLEIRVFFKNFQVELLKNPILLQILDLREGKSLKTLAIGLEGTLTFRVPVIKTTADRTELENATLNASDCFDTREIAGSEQNVFYLSFSRGNFSAGS